MKKTAQFGLNQWEMSDRIQMQDFNRDNAAIEAALAARNCQFYTPATSGTARPRKHGPFPAKPVLVVIIGQSITVLIRGFSIGTTHFGSMTHQLQVTWEEKSVAWTNTNNSGVVSANGKNDSYGLFAILEAE